MCTSYNHALRNKYPAELLYLRERLHDIPEQIICINGIKHNLLVHVIFSKSRIGERWMLGRGGFMKFALINVLQGYQ